VPSDLQRSQLQRRHERKFLLPLETIALVLTSVNDNSRVVLADSRRFACCDTRYFDTLTFRFDHDHRRRHVPHLKVRVCHYTDRALSMLELKEKTPRGETHKHCWERPAPFPMLTALDTPSTLPRTRGVIVAVSAPTRVLITLPRTRGVIATRHRSTAQERHDTSHCCPCYGDGPRHRAHETASPHRRRQTPRSLPHEAQVRTAHPRSHHVCYVALYR
jgi:hypothetical protein